MIGTATLAVQALTSAPSPPAIHQPNAVTAAITITPGTNTALHLVRQPLDGCAQALGVAHQRPTIWARVLSAPTVAARTAQRTRAVDGAAACSRSPAALGTGIDSPLNVDSSTSDRPSTTSPSTGTRSRLHEHHIAGPDVGNHHRRSRGPRAMAGIRAGDASWRSDSAVCRRARASSARPASTNAITTTTAS